MSAFSDFIVGFKRGWNRARHSNDAKELISIRHWFRTRRDSLEWAVQCQLHQIEDVGINSDFQAGYAEAMVYVWLSAGYPQSPMIETVRRMVSDHICKEPENAA